jgi:hypothetical protein
VPHCPDNPATIFEAAIATLDSLASGTATSLTGAGDGAALGGRALVDAIAKEAKAVWCAEKADLGSLAKCFVSIAPKEARKRRASYDSPEYASHVADERLFRFELDRILTNDDLAVDQQLTEIKSAADDFLEEHRTTVRHCILTLYGKLSTHSSTEDCNEFS